MFTEMFCSEQCGILQNMLPVSVLVLPVIRDGGKNWGVQ